MTKTTESVLFLFSPPMQACYSLSSAPTSRMQKLQYAKICITLCKNLIFRFFKKKFK